MAIIEYQEPVCLTVERVLSDSMSLARFVSDVTKEIGRLYEKAICDIKERQKIYRIIRESEKIRL